MNITYTRQGDYFVPNLILGDTTSDITLNKYGRMRLRFLEENRKTLYISLLMENKLNIHLKEIQETASQRVEILIQQLAEKENITEDLKAKDQMKWVGLMNNIRFSAEEIILNELIYV